MLYLSRLNEHLIKFTFDNLNSEKTPSLTFCLVNTFYEKINTSLIFNYCSPTTVILSYNKLRETIGFTCYISQ